MARLQLLQLQQHPNLFKPCFLFPPNKLTKLYSATPSCRTFSSFRCLSSNSDHINQVFFFCLHCLRDFFLFVISSYSCLILMCICRALPTVNQMGRLLGIFSTISMNLGPNFMLLVRSILAYSYQ